MDNDNRIQLKVLGISYSQIQTGAYALILAQIDGPYRIPVVIGATEAQSIAIRMENIIPPRPMTHDLFVSFAHAFGVKLKEVFIYKFEDGIFSSELTFSDGERQIVLDSRTSDAIGIAMRSKAPIYTTREIIDETGFIMEEHDITDDEASAEARQ
ncbi:bifunctional nuclease family protein, partial [uncultured Muribaculum sp.]